MTFSFFPKHFRPVRSGFPCSKTDIILLFGGVSQARFYERYKILETRCIKAILYITLLSVSHPSKFKKKVLFHIQASSRRKGEKKVQVKKPQSQTAK